MEDKAHGTGRWASAVWQEKFETADLASARRGNEEPGVLMLAPPTGDLMFSEGIVAAINDRVGSMLDAAEDEELGPEAAALAAAVIRGAVGRLAAEGAGTLVRSVGLAGGEPLMARLASEEFVRYAESLANFLELAASEGKSVVVSF